MRIPLLLRYASESWWVVKMYSEVPLYQFEHPPVQILHMAFNGGSAGVAYPRFHVVALSMLCPVVRTGQCGTAEIDSRPGKSDLNFGKATEWCPQVLQTRPNPP